MESLLGLDSKQTVISSRTLLRVSRRKKVWRRLKKWRRSQSLLKKVCSTIPSRSYTICWCNPPPLSPSPELGCSVIHLALAWVARLPSTSTVILGASKPEQVVDNLKAIDVIPKLTPEILEKIEKILDNKPAPEVCNFGGMSASGWWFLIHLLSSLHMEDLHLTSMEDFEN